VKADGLNPALNVLLWGVIATPILVLLVGVIPPPLIAIAILRVLFLTVAININEPF
jgi:hypothetical protein